MFMCPYEVHSFARDKTKIFFCLFVFFKTGVSLCSPGCPGTHCVDQAGFELIYWPACFQSARTKGVPPWALNFLKFKKKKKVQ